MIIWVYGEDTFRSREKLKELITSFKQKFDPGGLNLIFFKEKLSTDEIFQAATAAPFMSPKKMVIVEGLAESVKAKDWDELAPLWKRVPDESILVLWEGGHPKELDKAFKTMPKKEVYYYDYPLLSANEVRAWLIAQARSKGIKAGPAILDQLLQKVGQDIWRLDSELDKLKSRAAGQEIKSEYVDELIDTRLEDNIFIFCDFLGQRRAGQAVAVLEKLLKSGFNEIELLGKLIWQLKIILKLRSYMDDNPGANINMVARDLGIHPYAAKKIQTVLNKFDVQELKNIYQKALDLDVGLKSGKIDPRLGLELIVSNI
jgi:DNA polymerase-3 subunit delta